jgi:hypothetical protein
VIRNKKQLGLLLFTSLFDIEDPAVLTDSVLGVGYSLFQPEYPIANKE